MGAGSSKGNLDAYSNRAIKAATLSNDILNGFFENTDLSDLLELASLNTCPKYIFTTAQVLDGLFQKINLEPKLGKSGEILFTPITKVVPKEIPPAQAGTIQRYTQAQLQAVTQRNEMCFKIAYYYVRIFQIYAALSLTVMNADPSLKLRRAAPSQAGRRTTGPVAAPLQAGGGVQRGGALSTGSKSGIIKEIVTLSAPTPFVVLFPYLKYIPPRQETVSINQEINLVLEGIPDGNSFIIKFNASRLNPNQVTFDAVYQKANSERFKSEISFQRNQDTTIDIILDGNLLTTFQPDQLGKQWVIRQEDGSTTNTITELIKDIQEIYTQRYFAVLEERQQRAPTGQTTSTGSGPTYAYSITGSTSGQAATGTGGPIVTSTPFIGFDEVKKIFKAYHSGASPYFPKAYCIARAMTLITPVIQSEAKGQQYLFSEICKELLSFEPQGAALMPRPGKQVKANLYLRSLVTLYYDGYRFVNNELRIAQTESGKSRLQNASRLFADLYFVTQDKTTYLESTQQFKSYGICEKQGMSDIYIPITNEKEQKMFIDTLYSKIIMPMLAFQEEHTVNVNKLLAKMFVVGKDKQGKQIFRLSETLKKGGLDALYEIGVEANSLLLGYYLKSEAYFMNGVRWFKQNPNAWRM